MECIKFLPDTRVKTHSALPFHLNRIVMNFVPGCAARNILPNETLKLHDVWAHQNALWFSPCNSARSGDVLSHARRANPSRRWSARSEALGRSPSISVAGLLLPTQCHAPAACGLDSSGKRLAPGRAAPEPGLRLRRGDRKCSA